MELRNVEIHSRYCYNLLMWKVTMYATCGWERFNATIHMSDASFLRYNSESDEKEYVETTLTTQIVEEAERRRTRGLTSHRWLIEIQRFAMETEEDLSVMRSLREALVYHNWRTEGF